MPLASLVGPNFLDHRNLNNRSGLEFWFPETNKNFSIFKLPFFETPEIRETKTANYVKYLPLARSSPMFVYTGAEARTFKVETTLTVLHLLQHDMGFKKFSKLTSNNKEEDKKKFFSLKNKGTRDTVKDSEDAFFDAILKEELEIFQRELLSNAVQGPFAALILAPVAFGKFASRSKGGYIRNTAQKMKALDTLIYFITLSRLSVVNNASNPTLGPPIIRLNFGAAYNSIPCICESYDISYDDLAGYDLKTMLPNRFKIKFTLKEVRSGNFQEFEPGEIIKRDNLAGWEVMFNTESSPPTIDPLDTGSNYA